jgi:hypothetical protein
MEKPAPHTPSTVGGTKGPAPVKRWAFTGFDVVSLAIAAAGLLWSGAIALRAPEFGQAFSDFGSARLPALTELCLQPWFPISLALIPVVTAGAGVVGGASRNVRMVLMGVTIFLTFTLPGIVLYGLYLPIFEMAGAIK